MTVIELSDNDAAALKARAPAVGLTREVWLKQLARTEEESSAAERQLQKAADIVLRHMRSMPPEIMATMPKDGANQHDNYIYSWPKRKDD